MSKVNLKINEKQNLSEDKNWPITVGRNEYGYWVAVEDDHVSGVSAEQAERIIQEAEGRRLRWEEGCRRTVMLRRQQ